MSSLRRRRTARPRLGGWTFVRSRASAFLSTSSNAGKLETGRGTPLPSSAPSPRIPSSTGKRRNHHHVLRASSMAKNGFGRALPVKARLRFDGSELASARLHKLLSHLLLDPL